MKILMVQPGASYSTADVYNGLTDAFKAAGHEVHEFRLDARVDSLGQWLMWQWKKGGKQPPKPTWADILYQSSMPLLERALRFLPDWVVIVSVMNVHPDILICLRRMGAPVAFVYTESPYDIEHELNLVKWCDVAFTNERTCVDEFRAVQPRTYYLPHAFDPAKHFPKSAPEGTREHDIVFVGTAWPERVKLLSEVDWSELDFGLYGLWTPLGSRHRLRKYLVDPTPIRNHKTVALYAAAKVGLNLHRQAVSLDPDSPLIECAESMNPRALELAACQVFQVSDYRKEVGETFGPTVPTFSTSRELEEIIREAVGNEPWRRRMAEEARDRVRNETFTARVRYIIDKLDRAAHDRANHKVEPPVAV